MIRKITCGSFVLLLGACMAVDAEIPGEQVQDDPEAAIVSSVSDGIYVIRSVATNKCLDISGGSKANGAKVQQWTCNGTDAQKFRLTSIDGTRYSLINVGSNKAIDVKEASPAPNAEIIQYDYHGGHNQQFQITNRGGTHFSLHPRHNPAMALDLYWGRPEDGTPIVQYTYEGRDNQKWTLDRVSDGGATGGPGGDSSSPLPTRLRIRSECAEPIWIAHSGNVSDPQNIRLTRGQYHDYNIPDAGVSATRFWPKIGCDASGRNCTIGDSVAPCPAGGCQPPVDSKFEATFAPKGSAQDTWYNASQVDGYTLPYKIVPRGKGAETGNCITSDASNLSLDRCPTDEDLSGGGRFPEFAHSDLRIKDASGRTIGCMSPCKKWNYPAPWGYGRSESEDPGVHLCCPTPIDPASGQCTVERGCMDSPMCNDARDPLSVVHTDYVKVMGEMAPTTYSFAYDDAAGLHNCPSETTFEVTFCP